MGAEKGRAGKESENVSRNLVFCFERETCYISDRIRRINIVNHVYLSRLAATQLEIHSNFCSQVALSAI